MKKAITILAVLIVLVGAVFATEENHKIQIKTQVEGFPPVFQLYYSDQIKTNATRAVARTQPATAEGENFANKAENSPYTASMIDQTSVDISKEDLTAVFTAKLTGNVKLGNTTTYTIQFKAESLESTASHTVGTGNAQTTGKYYIAASEDDSGIAAAAAPDGVTMGQVVAPALNNEGTLVGSIPATMDTSNILPGDLATFTVNYDADADAPVDFYTAYIWMVVSAS